MENQTLEELQKENDRLTLLYVNANIELRKEVDDFIGIIKARVKAKEELIDSIKIPENKVENSDVKKPEIKIIGFQQELRKMENPKHKTRIYYYPI